MSVDTAAGPAAVPRKLRIPDCDLVYSVRACFSQSLDLGRRHFPIAASPLLAPAMCSFFRWVMRSLAAGAISPHAYNACDEGKATTSRLDAFFFFFSFIF